MGNRICAGLFRDLDQVLEITADGQSRCRADRRLHRRHWRGTSEDEIAHELLAHVLDEDFLDAEHLGLLARRLQFLALAEIGREGDDFSAELGLQPFQDDGGVETAGIGENDLFHVFGKRHDKTRGNVEIQLRVFRRIGQNCKWEALFPSVQRRWRFGSIL